MPRTRIALLIALAIGAAVGLLVPLPGYAGWGHRFGIGWLVSAVLFALAIFSSLWRASSQSLSERIAGRDSSRSFTDLVVLLAALGSLVVLGLMLLGGGKKPEAQTTVEAFITVGTVVASWVAVHTTWALRYARHFFNIEPGCIDFNTDEPPLFSDFAYFSFNLGMTYQVSDNNVQTSGLRRLVLEHCLVSYVFGTVIIAATINLVIGLASSG